MTWVWDQSAGELLRDGEVVSSGYSGHGEGKNSPSMQAAVGVGPIPRGRWIMTEVESGGSTGPFTIVLKPCDGTDPCGRSLFRIHGDSIKNPGEASHGCIILPPAVRHQIWDSEDRDLEVVE